MKSQFTGYAHTLSLLPWQCFGTLTFRKISPSAKMWACVWLHFQRVARTCKVPYGSVLIAVRYELGELGGRPHFHYLVGGLSWRNNRSLAGMCENEWRSRTGSLAEVRPYDPELGATDYLVKGLLDSAANCYERGKFDGAERVEVSDAVHATIRRYKSTAVHAHDAAPTQEENPRFVMNDESRKAGRDVLRNPMHNLGERNTDGSWSLDAGLKMDVLPSFGH